MSTFKVPVLEVEHVEQHPNADRLDIATVGGYPVVCGRGTYRSGDVVIYLPVDSLLPDVLVEKIQAGSKIQLKNRVRAAKIRGVISQGIILSLHDFLPAGTIVKASREIGEAGDVAPLLSVTKYEETPAYQKVSSGNVRKRPGNPLFKYYTDIENYKHYPNIFTHGEPVWISEKLHGTSFRCGWFPKTHFTWFDKLKKFFGFKVDEWDFCYGSRKVDITASFQYQGWYGKDIYGEIARKYSLKDILPHGYAVYGEIIGPGIQKGYDYSLKQHTLFIYDILDTVTGKWFDVNDMLSLSNRFGLQTVPTLAFTSWSPDIFPTYCEGKISTLADITREGCVVKPMKDEIHPSLGRKVLKMINPSYLLKDTTDAH